MKRDTKAFIYMVVFPVIPWALGIFAAIGCDLAGVGANGWWELIVVLTVTGTILLSLYGFKKGTELL